MCHNSLLNSFQLDDDDDTALYQAHYVNSDGTQLQTTIGYNIQEDSFFFTGDIITYNIIQAQNFTSASLISEVVVSFPLCFVVTRDSSWPRRFAQTLYILEDDASA